MIAAIIQARTGSSRLPKKVLANIVGKPLLTHVIQRAKCARYLDGVIIATTKKKADGVLATIAMENGVSYFRGDEEDVLDRYYQAATEFGADVIVRITADCPLIDPNIIDIVVQRYLKGDCDYAANILKRSYPDGLDVEVFSYKALEKSWKEARRASEREHVTPYIWGNPNKFKLVNVENSTNLSHLRWVVDQKEDLEFVRQVYKHLYKEGQILCMEDVLKLLSKHPDLSQINQGIATNIGYLASVKEDKIVE